MINFMPVTEDDIAALEEFAAYGLRLINEGSGQNHGYNRAAVEWLDNRLNEIRKEGKIGIPDIHDLADAYGPFLGKALIETCGGEWLRDNEGYIGVKVTTSNFIGCPMGKVTKQLSPNGEHDSVLSFFDVSTDVDSIVNRKSE